jgi:hypothetical protein
MHHLNDQKIGQGLINAVAKVDKVWSFLHHLIACEKSCRAPSSLISGGNSSPMFTI